MSSEFVEVPITTSSKAVSDSSIYKAPPKKPVVATGKLFAGGRFDPL